MTAPSYSRKNLHHNSTLVLTESLGTVNALEDSKVDHIRLWIGGMPSRTTEYAMLQLIRQFGPLADFSFPVHKYGDLQGSTVGYCFVTYINEKAANLALKTLNGLDFHGSPLTAKRAHPTRDEITLTQRATEEEERMRIGEETRRREAQLAARLAAGESSSLPLDYVADGCSPSADKPGESFVSPFEPRAAGVYSQMLGSLGRIHKPMGAEPRRPISQTAKVMAIRQIESALQRLDNTPVGGASMLQPCSRLHPRPLLPPGILASQNSSGSSNSHSFRGPCRRSRDTRPAPPPRRHPRHR